MLVVAFAGLATIIGFQSLLLWRLVETNTQLVRQLASQVELLEGLVQNLTQHSDEDESSEKEAHEEAALPRI